MNVSTVFLPAPAASLASQLEERVRSVAKALRATLGSARRAIVSGVRWLAVQMAHGLVADPPTTISYCKGGSLLSPRVRLRGAFADAGELWAWRDFFQ